MLCIVKFDASRYDKALTLIGAGVPDRMVQLVVAVTANIANAITRDLALAIAAAFAGQDKR